MDLTAGSVIMVNKGTSAPLLRESGLVVYSLPSVTQFLSLGLALFDPEVSRGQIIHTVGLELFRLFAEAQC